MHNFIFGAVGALSVMVLIAIGIFIGWKANNAFRLHSTRVAAEEASEEERRQLLAEQKAFDSMLNYNQDTAYGMNKGLSDMVGEE
jgi:hypothetical protein